MRSGHDNTCGCQDCETERRDMYQRRDFPTNLVVPYSELAKEFHCPAYGKAIKALLDMEAYATELEKTLAGMGVGRVIESQGAKSARAFLDGLP